MILNKYRHVAKNLNGASSLLDVGCRDAILATYLPPQVRYTGVDMVPGPKVTRVCNLEDGLPFEDRSFDVVTALDVLEHTDDIWNSFGELARVTRQKLFVVLPNLYAWRNRLRFFFGLESAKYVLQPEPFEDRHRWLTSYSSSRRFALGMAEKHGFEVRETLIAGGRRFLPFDFVVSLVLPNLGAWAALYEFRRKSDQP